jgi:hypothetical protein
MASWNTQSRMPQSLQAEADLNSTCPTSDVLTANDNLTQPSNANRAYKDGNSNHALYEFRCDKTSYTHENIPIQDHTNSQTAIPLKSGYKSSDAFDAASMPLKAPKSSRNCKQFSFLKLFSLLFCVLLGLLLFSYGSYICLAPSHQVNSAMRSRKSKDARLSVPVLEHLIIIPGHAIYLGDQLDTSQEGRPAPITLDEKEEVYIQDGFLLQNAFQLDQTPYFMRHIQRGVELLKQDPSAVLMFSGGNTYASSSVPKLICFYQFRPNAEACGANLGSCQLCRLLHAF